MTKGIKRLLTILVIVSASFTLISVHVVSYLNLNPQQIEFLSDFDFQGFPEFEDLDLGEDGDDFAQPFLRQEIYKSSSEAIKGQFLLYDHSIPGINNPPPEIA